VNIIRAGVTVAGVAASLDASAAKVGPGSGSILYRVDY
jgi:hypothetical protein